MNIGLEVGETCNRDSCKGIMQEQEKDTSCSCHINPPCSHCVDAVFECEECGAETETAYHEDWASSFKPMPIQYKYRSDAERYAELEDAVFGYITIPGKYYWMEYKGLYPKEMAAKDILSKFNVCFGYKWITAPANGKFHLKVYTD